MHQYPETEYLENTLGFYVPSFFFLKIELPEELKSFDEITSDKLNCTIIHEYTHFLQDVSTIQGMRNTIIYMDYLRNICENARNQIGNNIRVPVNPDYLTQQNLELINKTSGTRKLENKFQSVDTYICSPNGDINVTIISTDGSRGIFSFGTHCIRESMAYLVDSTITKDHPVPFFPYKIVEALTKNIYSEFCKDKNNLIVLCDISLCTDHPGHTFIKTLENFRDEKAVFSSPLEVYDCFLNCKIHSIEKTKKPIIEAYKELNSEIIKRIEYLFNKSDFPNLNDWVSTLYNYFRDFRNQNLHSNLIEWILRNGNTKDLIQKSILKIHPIIVDYTNTYYCDIPAVALFYASLQILKTLKGEQKKCDLLEFCRQYNRGHYSINEKCSNSPWDRMSANECKCPFMVLWNHWGLSSKKTIS